MEIRTLGTSSAVPSKTRDLPANMISFNGERLLFDCGEGTQKKIMEKKLGLMDISRIFISHWHADHFAGLIGLIQTMEMEGREQPLYVYGPPGTEEFTDRILDTGYFNRNYDIFVEDLQDGEAIVGEGYEVRPFEVEHGVEAFGYVFEEDSQRKANKDKMKELKLKSSPKIGKLVEGETIKWEGEKIKPEQVIEKVRGRKVVYSGDTSKCQRTVEESKNADVLIHEATCLHEIIDERENHTSAKQAGEIAKEADAEKLILTHISRRHHQNEKPLLEEAKEVFSETEL
ncbi:MAG: ribonuclease Z, partial [Nanohaloarchaea archaeon QH_8_44_6]